MTNTPLKVEQLHEGRLLKLVLARPKANIIDAEMIAALQSAFDEYKAQSDLAAVLLCAEGPNFSFGASVEEHQPDQCGQMLQSLHQLILSMLEYPVPILVAVQGFCLGGGLEVAIGGSLIFASPDAKFGQPEIQLAVFAPAASCLLPERIGQAHAEDLLWSGRNADAEEALRMGLIKTIDEDPEQAALAYFESHLASHSSCALRHAVWAAKHDFIIRMKEKLAAVETLYLQELMSSHDAVEGLNAFIEKRPAHWLHK
jgi:cyclohexa-1,5-dienecarbonyl-CoA hydratase